MLSCRLDCLRVKDNDLLDHRKIMQFTIISPDKFRSIPWKNGKGQTIELAINEGANLEDFDWRLSMADVVEDGTFSDFSGYLRNLVLIKGKAITLVHDETTTDTLKNYLDFATFDGGCITQGILPGGPITDFNIITNQNKYDVIVATYPYDSKVELSYGEYIWAYSLTDATKVISDQHPEILLPAKHLIQIANHSAINKTVIYGSELIVVTLRLK